MDAKGKKVGNWSIWISAFNMWPIWEIFKKFLNFPAASNQFHHNFKKKSQSQKKNPTTPDTPPVRGTPDTPPVRGTPKKISPKKKFGQKKKSVKIFFCSYYTSGGVPI